MFKRRCTCLPATDLLLYVPSLELWSATIWNLLVLTLHDLIHRVIATLGDITSCLTCFVVLNKSCKLIVICDSHGFWAIHWNDNRVLCITLRIEAITHSCGLIPFLLRLSMIPRGVYLRIDWCHSWFVCLSLSWLAGQHTFCILLIEDPNMLHIASKIGNSLFIMILKDLDLI